jgi:hypothetical protein
MNLLEFRQLFRNESGRHDLVNADGSDNGANFHINQGMRWLDREVDHDKTVGRVFKLVGAGDYYVTFQYSRAILEAWAMTKDDGRWQLERQDVQDFRLGYTDMWTAVDQGAPTYYTPAFLRAVPETDRIPIEDFEAIIGFTDIMIGENYEYNGILFMPPAEEQTQIEVWGKFYTMPMIEDAHQNYWSINHPDILLMAAQRQLEIFSRNRQGREDWEKAIREQLRGIEKDVIEEEMAEVSCMEG